MRKQSRFFYFRNIALCLLILYSNILFAAPQKSLWQQWQSYNETSTKVINHQPFQDFLTKYVYTGASGVNLVRYSLVSIQDKAALHQYLIQMSHIPIAQYNRQEQLAYWINVYNALTLETILKHYPVTSIRDIKLGGLFSSGPWDAKLITIDNIPISLNDIEHRMIRPIWHDPRTHYAINCASYSCPNLQKVVYSSQNLDAMLTADAKAYINSPRGVSIEGGTLYVSSIYDWYQEDFGDNQAAVIAHLEQYASPGLLKQLKGITNISGYRYNWQLNGK